MIVTTTDPITGREITNTDRHPFLIEGEGEYALKIFFESEDTKRTYLHQADEDDASDADFDPQP